MELIPCYAINVCARSRADHLGSELFTVNSVLLSLFSFRNATPQSFRVVHPLILALHLEIVVRAEGLQYAMLN